MLFDINITPSRIFQVFILQLGMGIFYCIMAIIILRRKRERLNLLISMFFLCVFVGTVINVIYIFIEVEQIVVPMQFITYYLFSTAQVFLLIFNLILLTSEKKIDTSKQLTILGVFGVSFLFILLIPDGVQINESTGFLPEYNLPYFLYAVILTTGYAIIPTIYTSILIYKKFKSKDLKKRWLFYILGIILYYVEWWGVSVSIYLNDPTVRLIWNTFALSLFISAYFIYYGIGRQTS